MEDGRTAFRRPPPKKNSPRSKALKKKLAPGQSVAKMKDQVMTIQTVQESSKSELSSGTFGHFKVCLFFGILDRFRGARVGKVVQDYHRQQKVTSSRQVFLTAIP